MQIRNGELWRLTNKSEVRVLDTSGSGSITVWNVGDRIVQELQADEFEARAVDHDNIKAGTSFVVKTSDANLAKLGTDTLLIATATGFMRDNMVELKEIVRNFGVSAFVMKADIDFTRREARRIPKSRPDNATDVFRSWYTGFLRQRLASLRENHPDQQDLYSDDMIPGLVDAAMSHQNDLLDAFNAGTAYADTALADKGPWTVSMSGDDVGIYSEDFHHDVALRVTGDFGYSSIKYQYALRIAASLNRHYRGL